MPELPSTQESWTPTPWRVARRRDRSLWAAGALLFRIPLASLLGGLLAFALIGMGDWTYIAMLATEYDASVSTGLPSPGIDLTPHGMLVRSATGERRLPLPRRPPAGAAFSNRLSFADLCRLVRHEMLRRDQLSEALRPARATPGRLVVRVADGVSQDLLIQVLDAAAGAGFDAPLLRALP